MILLFSGKTLFAYTDQELANRSGYDLIHPDDLNYFSCAHQELIKTGSSGLISYRWQTKLQQWIWMQSSCKVIYKNSKPDFIICTHRQLTEDEGQDLFSKRGNEFKLPYPLLDIDMCAGFGFGDDEMSTKSKPSKSKKKSSSTSSAGNSSANGSSSSGQLNGIAPPNGASVYDGGIGVTSGAGKDCSSGGTSSKKRKSNSSSASGAAAAATAATAACLIGGLPPYCAYPTGFVPYDGGGGAMMAPPGDPLKATESLYSYNPSSFGFDATDMYRAQGAYGALHAATTMYQHHQHQQHQAVSQEPYRLDMVDKHQSYFLDSNSRQYQPSHHHLSPALPPAPYGNTISSYGSGINCAGSEFVPPPAPSKYGYDVSGVPCAYGFDSYSLDFSKRMDCTDFSQISQIHPDMKRTYAFDYTSHAHHPTHAPSYPSHNNLIDPHNIHDRYTAASRLGVPPLDPVDLRSTTGLFSTNSFMNTVDTSATSGGASSSPCFSAGNNPTSYTTSNHSIPSPASSSMFKPVAISASSATAASTTPLSLAANAAQHQPTGDAKDISSPDVTPGLPPLILPPSAPYDQQHVPFSLPHNSVIKSTRQRNSHSHLNQTHPPSSSANCDMSGTGHSRSSPGASPWRYCNKSDDSHAVSPMASLPQLAANGDLSDKMGEHKFPSCGDTPALHDTNNHLRCQTKESSMTGIPVSVVKQPTWTQINGLPNSSSSSNTSSGISETTYSSNNVDIRDRTHCGGVDSGSSDGNNNNNRSNSNENSSGNLQNNHINSHVSDNSALLNNNTNNSSSSISGGTNCPGALQPDKDWISSDLYSKSPRVLFSDPCHSVKHLGLKVYERGDNPLLSFSEMTHSLMSSTY
ncbi:aryl hydrocarbon receptor [Elysia marginata]|uniref:Aryl hydrocarbon receptor n=1 Tax=Elysia marginata TaxID=1093978 RepID=A0AAV4I8T8_9GAST|nr:aryl hydrocarbon receptor [Elysia marginata]